MDNVRPPEGVEKLFSIRIDGLDNDAKWVVPMVGDVLERKICVRNFQNMVRSEISTSLEIHTEKEIVVSALFAM